MVFGIVLRGSQSCKIMSLTTVIFVIDHPQRYERSGIPLLER